MFGGEFEWNVQKNQINVLKHGISFVDVCGIFTDPMALTLEQTVKDELWHITLAMNSYDKLLVVVYVRRENNIRIISARKANRWEKKQYENKL